MEHNPFSVINEKLAEIQRRMNVQEKPAEEWLDINGACDLMKLSKSAIYKRTMEQSIPFYKTGKKLLFKRSELEDYVTKFRAVPYPVRGIHIER